jgi:hypothetical protein
LHLLLQLFALFRSGRLHLLAEVRHFLPVVVGEIATAALSALATALGIGS